MLVQPAKMMAVLKNNPILMTLHWSKSRRYTFLLISITLSFIMGGCSAFRPKRSIPSADQPPLFIAPTMIPAPTATATPDASKVEQQPANCTNLLSYLKDLTIPDGSVVKAGASIQKQWQVRNDGTCNWNEQYTIRLISGSSLGASSPQGIVPARGGAEGIIQINFIAPTEAGNYISTWQAFDPAGNAFGDFFSIEVNVSAQ